MLHGRPPWNTNDFFFFFFASIQSLFIPHPPCFISIQHFLPFCLHPPPVFDPTSLSCSPSRYSLGLLSAPASPIFAITCHTDDGNETSSFTTLLLSLLHTPFNCKFGVLGMFWFPELQRLQQLCRQLSSHTARPFRPYPTLTFCGCGLVVTKVDTTPQTVNPPARISSYAERSITRLPFSRLSHMKHGSINMNHSCQGHLFQLSKIKQSMRKIISHVSQM